jgi:hypothetical protein
VRDQSPRGDRLAPRTIQLFGGFILLVLLVAWVVTGREAPVLVAAGVALAMLSGSYDRARYELERVLQRSERPSS